MKIIGIYKIQSKIKSYSFYVGSSVNITRRWREHLAYLKKNIHYNPKIQNHYNKYGVEDFEFSVLEECSINKLLDREQVYIDLLEPYFNITLEVVGSPNRSKKVRTKDRVLKELLEVHEFPLPIDDSNKLVKSEDIVSSMRKFYAKIIDIKDKLTEFELLIIEEEYKLRYSRHKKYIGF